VSVTPAIFAGGRRWRIALVALFALGQAAAAGAAAFATRDVFAAMGTHALPLGALAFLAAAGVATALLRAAERRTSEAAGQHYAMALRRALYEQFATMALADVARQRAGGVGLRFVGDLSAARGWAGRGLSRVVTIAIVVPGAGLALWIMNPALALAAMAPLGLAILAMLALSAFTERLHRRLRKTRSSLAISMLERVPVAPLLDRLGRTPRELDRLDREGAKLARRGGERIAGRERIRAVADIGGALGGVAILWVAVREGLPGAEAAGALAVLAILAQPVRDLAGVWDAACAWWVAQAKCVRVLEKHRRPPARRLGGPSGRLVLEGVAVGATRLDLELAPGDRLAVIGGDEPERTAFLRVVAGLDPPAKGHVSRSCPSEGGLVWIGSGAPFLAGSLRRALTLGSSSRPPDVRLTAVAERVGLGALLDRRGGLDGRIAEGARDLGPAERTRILLARALLNEPALIVADRGLVEADPHLATLLRAVLEEARATVIVASRDATGLPADARIVEIAHDAACEVRIGSA
jgi:ABC-type transport system involved in cytochrome bd biosynthesis fused ATPase/permease subunit